MTESMRLSIITAKSCIKQMSPDAGTPSDEIIKAGAKIAFKLNKMPDFSENELVEFIKKDYIHYLPPWQIIDEDQSTSKHEKWLDTETKNKIKWEYWERYEQSLREAGKIPERVLFDSGHLIDDILGRLESPDRKGPWDRRGLVVGEVQAGKTGNYIGLACKAIDAGYKVVIVLAGLHNNLRSQTQIRLDSGIRGQTKKDNSGEQKIGVGKLNGWHVNRIVHYLTDSSDLGDFKLSRATGIEIGSDPVVLVVKKNKSILENVRNWIAKNDKTHGAFPLLLIDDEADNASINTRSGLKDDSQDIDEDLSDAELEELHKKNTTTINRLIRELLQLSNRTAYVGYTATPQANLFIDPDAYLGRIGADLFPESFIINIVSPPNYFGASRVFGIDGDQSCGISESQGLPVIRTVSDNDTDACFPVKHKKMHVPQCLPSSLREAILCFILTIAARRARGQVRDHNSMLIHVTRFIDVQSHVKSLVTDELADIQMRIRYGDGASKKQILRELELLWINDYLPTTISMLNNEKDVMLTWEQVLPEIKPAVDQINEVRSINGHAKDVLDYDEYKNGLTVIAIGGDKLSRGLTLEGLSVSYYLRSTRMYDTLMQMGRWFGYRKDYEDLCRIYTTPDLIKCYRGIAMADHELRREFSRMNECYGTPADYGLKVRSGICGMLVTALNRMRHGTDVQLTFADYTAQLPYFPRNNSIAEHNYNQTQTFLNSLAEPDRETANPHLLWRNIDSEKIITFASKFKCCSKAFRVDATRIAEYLKIQNANNNLLKWDVALINIRRGEKYGDGRLGEVGMSKRQDDNPEEKEVYSLVKGTLLDAKCESLGLTADEMKEAEKLTRNHMDKFKKKYLYPLSTYIRFVRGKRANPEGLLQIYVLDHKCAGLSYPVIGYVFTFPPLKDDNPVSYKVTKTWLKGIQQELGIDDI